MNSDIEKLAKMFSEFPGIGLRQSKRFVFFLLGREKEFTGELIERLKQLRQKVAQCSWCYRYFPADGNELCDICASKKTNPEQLLIVEKDSDLDSVRKSKTYIGRYFVLGGLVPIIDKTTDRKIRINELMARVEDQTKEGLCEVIIALSLNPQGENTDRHVREKLSPLSQKFGFKISSLGRGLSTGSELEYADDDTIKYAMENRR